MNLAGKIESQLNHILGLDGDAMERIANLSGQVVSLELLNTEFVIYILPSASGVKLKTEYSGNANVRIRGTPSDMAAYLLRSKVQAARFAGSLEIIGDVGLAQELQSIIENLDLDWEEQLSRWFGDTTAHKLGRFLRTSARIVGNSGEKLQKDVSEYLRFEADLTLDRTEMDEFTSAVDKLRNDVERIKLRIQRLEQDKQV